jgi:hypothetical protein
VLLQRDSKIRIGDAESAGDSNPRAPRYHLGGVVELTDLDSGRMKVALVRALSLYECLVKTEMPVNKAAKVALRIGHSGTHSSALGL